MTAVTAIGAASALLQVTAALCTAAAPAVTALLGSDVQSDSATQTKTVLLNERQQHKWQSQQPPAIIVAKDSGQVPWCKSAQQFEGAASYRLFSLGA